MGTPCWMASMILFIPPWLTKRRMRGCPVVNKKESGTSQVESFQDNRKAEKAEDTNGSSRGVGAIVKMILLATHSKTSNLAFVETL